jgi:hypothetical protein
VNRKEKNNNNNNNIGNNNSINNIDIYNIYDNSKSSVISERDITVREEINIVNSLRKLFLFQELDDKEL